MSPEALQAGLDRVHGAGLAGIVAEVREDGHAWLGAAGVADTDTRRPMDPRMRLRVGSVTKTFTAAAIMRRCEAGEIDLDKPVAHYLPRLVPGERGARITVRMLLSHTSGLADYLPTAYPSLKAFPVIAETSPASMEDHQFTRFDPIELIEMGVSAPPVAAPEGRPGIYSNTGYLLLGQLLELVTGCDAEQHVTETLIEPLGLSGSELPTQPRIEAPHPKMYERWFGMYDPPHDFSVFDMSWVRSAASLVSTVTDLNRFFGLLLGGEIVSPSSLEQMRRTGPVIAFDGSTIDYGLGLTRTTTPGQGTFWGHDGTAWGAGALLMTSEDGRRQVSIALNEQRWNLLDAAGIPQPHPIDAALQAFVGLALGE
ncbi:D-alanyl-D-alanine carboxypeptidase [Nocardioides albertanoniae]|uniref:D-alanyl-D-alanine carboxypeptidase n=1 Tax=Nocardioides albertanoniae TaxID=1175486 RepID=A0A543A5A2_9ACTN|nr:serine hydrolase domain-containing protein [Nocardioides albertanoniae]TQL67772.1 D-alanyl-D-alanine carboxypeptidase [Nocardioides albertanoniae]